MSRSATVAIALGGNLGNRRYNLMRAVHELGYVVRVVCVSTVHETAPVDAPPGSPMFLNMVITGYTPLPARALVEELLAIEVRLGRRRRGVRNAPRTIDLDLILYSARRMRTESITLPHPRATTRPFVMVPLGECSDAAVRFLERTTKAERWPLAG